MPIVASYRLMRDIIGVFFVKFRIGLTLISSNDTNMVRRCNAGRVEDESSSSSRQKDQLTNSLKSQLSSSSSTDKISDVNVDDSELGSMNQRQAPQTTSTEQEEPMRIVGDIVPPTSGVKTTDCLHSSFQFDHEQDEASLAQLEWSHEDRPTVINLPESPVHTIQKSTLLALTPETAFTAYESYSSSSSCSELSASERDTLPMDEEEMEQEQQNEKLHETQEEDSLSASALTPPRSNRKSSSSLNAILVEENNHDDSSTLSTCMASIMEEEQEEDSEYVSLSDKIQTKEEKKQNQATGKQWKSCGPLWRKNKMNHFDSEDEPETGCYSLFFGTIESMLGEFLEGSEIIGQEVCTPMSASAGEGMEDEAKPFDEAIEDMTFHA